MEKFLKHPAFRVVKHISLLLPLLYYTCTLAAIIYPYDHSWGWSLLKGLPVYGLLVFGWLYFYRFKVLNLSYKAMSIFSTLLFVIIYYPFFPLLMLWDIGPETDGGDYRTHMSLWMWVENIALTLNRYVFVWSPYIFFIYFLRREFNRKCPKCKLVNGLFAKKILYSEHRGTSSRSGLETTQKRTTIMYGPNAGQQRIENETNYVTYTTTDYEVFCSCKVCDHKWSYDSSYITKS